MKKLVLNAFEFQKDMIDATILNRNENINVPVKDLYELQSDMEQFTHKDALDPIEIIKRLHDEVSNYMDQVETLNELMADSTHMLITLLETDDNDFLKGVLKQLELTKYDNRLYSLINGSKENLVDECGNETTESNVTDFRYIYQGVKKKFEKEN